MHNLLLLLALAIAPVAQLPIIHQEASDLYYYDEYRSMRALPITNKIFVTVASEETEKWLAEKQVFDDLTKFEKKKVGDVEGFVVYFKDLKQTIDCMKVLRRVEIPHVPIVSYEEIDCIPSNNIVCSVRFSARPDTIGVESLAKHMKSAYDLDFNFLRHVKGDKYVIQGIKPKNPPTVMGLANLMAEDTSWFSGAKVIFVPINAPVVATMHIANPAGADLGYTRNLVLTIKTFNGAAKIRKDMLPKLGQGGWFPTNENGSSKEECG